MRVLVTGAAGFAGRYLIRELTGARHTVLAVDTALAAKRGFPAHGKDVSWRVADLLDTGALNRLLPEWQPEAAVHLAAIASVTRSQADPAAAYRINVGGTLNLLRAFRRFAPAARLLIVSTAQVYGNRSRTGPLREDTVFEPGDTYAESKAWTDFFALLYADLLGMAVMTVRPHNHTGPGQSADYAVPAFAAQVAAVARGRAPLPLLAGNLDSRRDISDVRDVVTAYRLLLEKGRPGQAYNIASGSRVAMRDVMETFCRLAGIEPVLKTDPSRWRPTDASPLLDTSALRADTGWSPRIPLHETLRDVWAIAYNQGETACM